MLCTCMVPMMRPLLKAKLGRTWACHQMVMLGDSPVILGDTPGSSDDTSSADQPDQRVKEVQRTSHQGNEQKKANRLNALKKARQLEKCCFFFFGERTIL